MRQYITTAIDTPNAPPHMGHAMERVMADVLARWYRLRGDQVRFQVGTDEHGMKMERTAEKMGITPEELLNRHVPLFQKLCDDLSISYDIFFHTHDKKTHWETVQNLWIKLNAAGKLEKRDYTALYCVGCERFMTKRDLVDGLCPNHQSAPEKITEKNWFFLLKNDGDNLRNLLTSAWDSEHYHIIPEFRSKETLSLIDGLDDISFSRPNTSLSWGIPVPDDEEQTMYVWCDALTNYISGLGIFTDHEERMWWDDAKVTHVIGKDIARFHALYWPAMLKHAGIRIPDQLLIHGFVTSEGQKMSKTLGNIVMPDDVLMKYGADPLRFYLSHEVPVGRDGDFSWERMQKLYDATLRNTIGNLLNRALTLLNKEGGNVVMQDDNEIAEYVSDYWKKYSSEMENFDFSNAVEDAIAFAISGNKDMENKKPWTLAGQEKIAVLGTIVEKLRHIALMLLPFMPETAQKISAQLGVPYANRMLEKNFVITGEMMQWGSQNDWKTVGTPEILFPPVDK